MIPTRTHTETENRDQNIYLGIDGSNIPFEYFKGVYLEEGLVFTDDAMHGIQFFVDRDNECVRFVDLDPNLYVLREDLENDEWIIVMRPLTQTTNSWIIDSRHFITRFTDQSDLYKLYITGKQGVLDASRKVYDDEGIYYMKEPCKFDTRMPKDSTLIKEVKRHISFVFKHSISLGKEDVYMHTKRKVWDKFIHELKQADEERQNDTVTQNAGRLYGMSFRTRFYEDEINGENTIIAVSPLEMSSNTIYFVEGKTNHFFMSKTREV